MISLQAIDSTMASTRKISSIESAIYLLRGQRVMLDSDLAAIYGVSTRQLNQQLKRNRSRFPDDFAFQLSTEEFRNLKSQIATPSLMSQSVTSSGHGGRRKLPWAFTEHGALMLASVLNSEVAVQASVRVVRAFVKLREMIAANAQLAAKLEELERRFDSHDEAIANLFATLKQLVEPSEAPKKREIGFHVREEAARYRVRKAPRIRNRNSRIS
jgi:ORF6N domain-containing protein